MRTIVQPASEADRRFVAELLARVRGATDSGAALLRGLDPPEVEFATVPNQVNDVRSEWVCAPGTSSAGVLLYLHGRRFQFDEPPSVFAAPLSRATGLPVLLTHFRLAPAHPYPAALDDVLTAYLGLLGQGHPANRIVLVGHSAGATLALSLLQRLRALDKPMPVCAIALSPITDFTLGGNTLTDNAGTDVIDLAELHQVRAAYVAGADPADASPLSGSADGFPPLLVGCGGAEMLRADATRFAELADAAGVDVTLAVHEGMPHGFPVLPTDSSAELLRTITGFAVDHLHGGTVLSRPLTIRRLGWACYEIVSERGTRVLVDPYLAGREGFHSGLPESPIDPLSLTGVDVVAVTHAGYDHRGQALDIVQGGQAVLVSGTALFQQALGAGVPLERLAPMVSGVEFHFRDVTIKSLPARHESTMRLDGQFVADQPQSFLVTTAAGRTVLCGGDFSLSEDVRTWGELYRPDIAVLGIGGITVGAVRVVELPPADAAIAARWLGAATVIPVHHAPGDPAPAQLAAALGTKAEVVPLGFGETWTDNPGNTTALR